MATNQSAVVTSHSVLNYVGMLFNKGNTKTPFSTLIGGKSRTTNAWKFATSLDYASSGGSAQPAITETASLTAPTREFVTRTQNVNVCQIYQRAIKISYGKLSSMGSLSGINIAGGQPNPANELDFQVAAAMAGIAQDIEYVFLNGAYQDGNYDDVAYKTKGITAAITTNAVAAGSTPLDFWKVAEAIEKIAGYAPTNNLVLLAKPVNVMQFNADCSANGMTIVPNSREINGIRVSEVITPFGNVAIVPDALCASGTALIVDPSVCAPVYMPVPGKGNFFIEALSKTGAADDYQIYGQVGLDYGCEVCHAKITGLTTSFTAPTYSKSVFIANTTSSPVPTQAITG